MRILKNYDERKNEILDVAQKLFYSVGYDRTTVNVIIEEVGIAKGTFYYYFKSKLDLLENLVGRMVHKIMEALKTIIDADTNAAQKLINFYNEAAAIKIENREIVMQMMKVLYRDENLMTRHKMYEKYLEEFGPVYSRIIRLYENAAERILGAEEGSLKLYDTGRILQILDTKSLAGREENDKN